MNNKKSAIVLMVIILVLGVFSFLSDNSKHSKNDAVSGATKKAKIMLPKKSDTYDVIGVVNGLKNFAVKYSEDFYRGGQILSIEGVDFFKERGIKTIIAVTPTDLERLICEKYDIDLIELPFEKMDLKPATLELFIKAYKAARKPVYIHCHGGTHRGGLLGYVYRKDVLGWDNLKAKEEYESLGGDPDNKDVKMFTVAKNFQL